MSDTALGSSFVFTNTFGSTLKRTLHWGPMFECVWDRIGNHGLISEAKIMKSSNIVYISVDNDNRDCTGSKARVTVYVLWRADARQFEHYTQG